MRATHTQGSTEGWGNSLQQAAQHQHLLEAWQHQTLQRAGRCSFTLAAVWPGICANLGSCILQVHSGCRQPVDAYEQQHWERPGRSVVLALGITGGHDAPCEMLHAICCVQGITHLVASLCQRLYLAPPLLPEGPEAVHQQEGGTILPRGGGLCSTAAGCGSGLLCSGREQNERSCFGQVMCQCACALA